jgi:tetratricopeptide (TPR) repeat protein
MRAEHTAAHDVASRFLALSGEHPGMAALANRFFGQTLWMMGNFAAARSYLERALEIYAINKETITAFRQYGADDHVAALTAISRTLWILGYPEQASAAAKQAIANARAMGRAFTLALALDGEAFLALLGADLPTLAAHTDEAMAHSVEHSLSDFEHRARFMQGALLAQGSDPKRGIELMRGAVAALEYNRQTMYLGHIASAHAKLGQVQAGVDILGEAIQIVEATEERFFEAELHRLLGTKHLLAGKNAKAEDELQQALSIARTQKARVWELRAATTLARHWHSILKHAQAYSLLQPVYSSFEEGFELTDLKRAKALLNELSAVLGQRSAPASDEIRPSQSARA